MRPAQSHRISLGGVLSASAVGIRGRPARTLVQGLRRVGVNNLMSTRSTSSDDFRGDPPRRAWRSSTRSRQQFQRPLPGGAAGPVAGHVHTTANGRDHSTATSRPHEVIHPGHTRSEKLHIAAALVPRGVRKPA